MEALAHLVDGLSGIFAVKQSPNFHRLVFDYFSLQQDGFAASEAGVKLAMLT